MLELHKLPFRTAQIHLELPFCAELHTKKLFYYTTENTIKTFQRKT